MDTKKLIVIVGPTAVGKTAAAVAVAERLHTEIISADSRQIYKELNIGTAKPTAEELKKAVHHFISCQSIHEEYDAGQYGREALQRIHELFKKYNQLVLVGGSGLYLKAVLDGFDDLPDIEPSVREKIQHEYQTGGIQWLQEQVKKHDPEFFASVDTHNPHRLMRALELLSATGQPMKALRQKKKIEHSFGVIKIGLNIPRAELYRRIDSRMDAMIASGLFDEARQFYPFKNLNALQTVGYREIFGFLDGQHDYEETVRLLKRNSRRYAKRQLTWFLRDEETTWFESEHKLLEWLTVKTQF
ncbi:MAG: tRNA (adenosine(37)-N6)-dimethylallyltransferase MiaA [Bacteroidetes bacterium]|nr:tRNA (adenosine(37)-N6)-dimethylallyltransferase MiaA [Bacteroidota bacterium]MBS1540861.1 tRNA (adenosine(37)-N6)-dimethylallyltransferase MiaA [Bacteroidota bacterium]